MKITIELDNKEQALDILSIDNYKEFIDNVLSDFRSVDKYQSIESIPEFLHNEVGLDLMDDKTKEVFCQTISVLRTYFYRLLREHKINLE